MSFGWTGVFRQGAWRDFRTFVLSQRRDVIARMTVINAELNRIGNIRILYARRDQEDPNSPMSEARVGIDVTPGTSLAKLLQAYVAQGGNPFDISMFLTPGAIEVVDDPTGTGTPDTTEQAEGDIAEIEATDQGFRETQPYSGSTYAATTDPVSRGLYTGGWLPLWRYPPRRFGNNQSYADQAAEVSRDIHAMRGWVTREIKTLRNDLEARIIKLCDLREQLLTEMNELIPQAVGGVIAGVNYSTDQYAVSHHVSAITDAIDSVFYPVLPDGTFDFVNPRVTDPNPAYPTLLDDAPNSEEDWCAIG